MFTIRVNNSILKQCTIQHLIDKILWGACTIVIGSEYVIRYGLQYVWKKEFSGLRRFLLFFLFAGTKRRNQSSRQGYHIAIGQPEDRWIGVSLLGLFACSGEPDVTFKHRNSSEFQTVRYSYTRLAVSRKGKERKKREIVGVSIGREWTRRLRETAVRHCAPAENSPQVCCQTRTCSEKVQHGVCRYGPCYRSPFFLSLAVRLHWRRAVLRAWTRLGRENIRNADDFVVRGILYESRENRRLTSILRESFRLVCSFSSKSWKKW